MVGLARLLKYSSHFPCQFFNFDEEREIHNSEEVSRRMAYIGWFPIGQVGRTRTFPCIWKLRPSLAIGPGPASDLEQLRTTQKAVEQNH